MNTGIVSTRRLRASGVGATEIRRAIRDGALTRLRRGWYALPSATPAVTLAVRVGGRLGCVSALAWHGSWAFSGRATHVRVSSGVAVDRAPEVHLHWTSLRVGPGIDTIEEALASAVACCDFRTLVAVIDSLANRRIVSPTRLRRTLGASARGRRALAAHDPAAESGIETLLRIALRRVHIRTRSQVVIPGVGRVDFLIGERLVVEADGYEWHGGREAFERDRNRDRELVRRGYVVLRASYRRVVEDIDSVTLAVLDVVRRRDHKWRAVHRTQLSRSGYLVDESAMKGLNRES